MVKDIFLFSCYTGLAYADVQKLKRSEIVVGMMAKNGFLPTGRKPIALLVSLCYL